MDISISAKLDHTVTGTRIGSKEYGGDDGIVDVFTTNKDLGEDFSNYGDTMIIKSVEDYQKWSKYESLSNEIGKLRNLVLMRREAVFFNSINNN